MAWTELMIDVQGSISWFCVTDTVPLLPPALPELPPAPLSPPLEPEPVADRLIDAASALAPPGMFMSKVRVSKRKNSITLREPA